MVLLLCGAVGTGKTTVCQKVVNLCRQRGLPCAGILSLPQLDGQGEREGILAQDVATGDRWLLARRAAAGDVCIGQYAFEQEAVQRAVVVLQNAAKSDAALLIVDEVGPLELWLGQGFAPLLPEIARTGKHVLIVVRDGLVPLFLETVEVKQTVYPFCLTPGNRDELPKRMVETIDPARVPDVTSPYPPDSADVRTNARDGKGAVCAGRQAVAGASTGV